MGFHGLHGFLGQFHSSLIGGCYQFDRWMLSFPRHRLSKVNDSIHGIEQGSIPVLL
jgi:hypothetical protein